MIDIPQLVFNARYAPSCYSLQAESFVYGSISLVSLSKLVLRVGSISESDESPDERLPRSMGTLRWVSIDHFVLRHYTHLGVWYQRGT